MNTTVVNIEHEKWARDLPEDTDYLIWKSLNVKKLKALESGDEVDLAALKELAKYEAKLRAKVKSANKEAMIDALSEIDEEEAKADRKAEIRNRLVNKENMYLVKSINKWISLNLKQDDPKKSSFICIDDRLSNIKKYMPDFCQDDYGLLCEIMIEDGRNYKYITSSFKKQEDDTLNLLVKDFLEPISGNKYHPFFDVVIKSICGDDEDAINHVEQLIVNKWRVPEDYNIPALVLDDDGGTGKNLFVGKLLGTIFKKRLVVQTKLENIAGRFNSLSEGKAVVYIDEVSATKKDMQELRRIIHAEYINIEKKGIDAQIAENTPWYILSGNNVGVGTVQLTGTAQDRRVSIVAGDKPLWQTFNGWLVSQGCAELSKKDAIKWIKSEGQHILTDKDESARFLGHLLEKHGDVEDLDAFHGKAYLATLNTQKDYEDQVCEAIFLDPNFEYVRKSVVYEFFKHVSGRNVSNKVFYARVQRWIEKNGNKIRSDSGVYWPGMTNNQSVFVSKSFSGKIENNDKRYYDDNYGKPVWKFSI